ncbi:hypothetical protein N8639_00220 [bacterium]|nr:hypothetical protein [bacterium]
MQQPTLTEAEASSDKGREILAICHSISNEGQLTPQGLQKLRDWLHQNSGVVIPAVTFIRQIVETVMADNFITKEEGQKLFAAINNLVTQLPLPNDNVSVQDSATPTLGWQGYRTVQFNLLIGNSFFSFGYGYLLLSVMFLSVLVRMDPKNAFFIQNVVLAGGFFIVAVCLRIMIGYFELRSFKRIRLKLYSFEIQSSGFGNPSSSGTVNYHANTSLGKFEIRRSSFLSLCRFAQIARPNASDSEMELQAIQSGGSFKLKKDVEFECGETRRNLLGRWLSKQDTKLWDPFIPVDSPKNSTSTK